MINIQNITFSDIPPAKNNVGWLRFNNNLLELLFYINGAWRVVSPIELMEDNNSFEDFEGQQQASINPNCLYDFGSINSLSITLDDYDNNKGNEYLFQFTVNNDNFELQIEPSISFSNELEWVKDNSYQVSILNGLGVVGEWEQ